MLRRTASASSTTPVAVATIPLTDNTSVGFRAHIVGRQAAGNTTFRTATATFKRTSGTSALVGANIDTDLGTDIGGAPSAVWTLGTNTAVLTLTGDGAASVTWSVEIEALS